MSQVDRDGNIINNEFVKMFEQLWCEEKDFWLQKTVLVNRCAAKRMRKSNEFIEDA